MTAPDRPTEPGGALSTDAGPDDLACIELVELVTSYLEGALDDAQRARVDRHLAGCGGCHRYVEQMRATIAIAGRLEPDDVPPESIDRLLDIFRSARRSD
jgi:anti-sigma factor RsiW